MKLLNGVQFPFIQKRADQEVVVENAGGAISNTLPPVNPEAIAAVVRGVRLTSWAFALADMQPQIMRPWELAAVARDVLLRGEWIAYMELRGLGFDLIRAMQSSVRGSYSPRTWTYDLTLPSPSNSIGTTLRDVSYAGICHVRIDTYPTSPWRGISPLEEAGVTVDLLKCIEDGLAEETDGVRTTVLSYGPSAQDMTNFRSDLAEGGLQVLDQSADQWGGRGRAGASETVRATHIGPQPLPQEVTLRNSVSQDVISLLGIPSGMFSPREGSVSREAYRQWHASSLVPLGEAFARELEEKLEIPISVDFHRVAAADIMARARGFRSMVDAGVDPVEAARIAGLGNVRMAQVVERDVNQVAQGASPSQLTQGMVEQIETILEEQNL